MMNAPALPASAVDYIAHIEHAFELIVVLDAGGRIVRANAAAGDILGYTPDELAGRPVCDLLHPDEHDALAADCDEVQGYLMARPMPFGALQSWLDGAVRN